MALRVRAYVLGVCAAAALLAPRDASAQLTVNLTYGAEQLRVGFPVSFIAFTAGGPGPVEFQFWRFDGTAWHLGQPYGASASYVWTPGPADAHEHVVQVWVRTVGASPAYEAWATTGYFTVAAPLPLTVLLSPPTPAPRVGTLSTWSAAAMGGSGGAEYRFLRLDPDGWKVVREYSTERTYSWTPGIADAGEHALQVWARAVGSTAAYEAWAGSGSFAVAGLPPPIVNAFTVNAPLPLVTATAATWTVMATGSASLEYKFFRLDADGWKVGQEYSTSNTYTWTPGSADIGSHVVQAYVRYVGSSAAYDAWATSGYFMVSAPPPPPPPTVTSLTASVAFPLRVGAAATWTAIAAGSGTLEYRFVRLDPDGWKVAEEYGSSNTYTWTPTLADIGSHTLQVWVRAAGSTAAYDAWLGNGPFNVQPVGSVTLSPALPPRVPAGAATIWTAASVGLPSPLFEFSRFNAGAGVWQIVQPYAAANIYTWIPGAADIGVHRVRVRARASASAEPFDASADGPLFEVMTPIPVSVSVSPALPALANTALTFSAAVPFVASAGKLLEYQFWRYDGVAAAWKMVQDFTATQSHRWNPGVGDIATHAIQVRVREVGYADAYHGYAGSGNFAVGCPPVLTVSQTSDLFKPPTLAEPFGGIAWNGSPVTFTARTCGTADPLEFQFVKVAFAMGLEQVIQDYSASNALTWTPLAIESNVTIRARVRRTGAALGEAAADTMFSVWPASADLSVRIRTVPFAATVGQPVVVLDTITNHGTAFSSTCTIKYDVNGVAVGTRLVPPLAPGEANNGEIAFNMPALTPRSYWFFAATASTCFDLNNTNNLASVGVRITP